MTTAKAEQAPVGCSPPSIFHTSGSFYWYLALLACVGGFLFGYDTSNIGSALPFIPYQLSDFAVGYLVAGASIGAAAGALVAGPLTDRFGRKFLLIIDVAIYAVGAIVSAVALNADMLLSARTLIGVAIGADFVIATAYIAEFAPKSQRGSLSLIQQWMITVGILVSYIVALVLLKLAPDSATGLAWRLMRAWARSPRSSASHCGLACRNPQGGCCSVAARRDQKGAGASGYHRF